MKKVKNRKASSTTRMVKKEILVINAQINKKSKSQVQPSNKLKMRMKKKYREGTSQSPRS